MQILTLTLSAIFTVSAILFLLGLRDFWMLMGATSIAWIIVVFGLGLRSSSTIRLNRILSASNMDGLKFFSKDGVLLFELKDGFRGIGFLKVSSIEEFVDVYNDTMLASLARSFAISISSISCDAILIVRKKNIPRARYLSDIERKIGVLEIMLASDPTDLKAKRRLSDLMKIRERILRGENPIEVSYYVCLVDRDVDVNRLTQRINDSLKMLKGSLEATMGLKLSKPSLSEISEIMLLGILGEESAKGLKALTLDLAHLAPYPDFISKSIETQGVLIGFSRDTGSPVMINPESLLRHVLVVGPTGTGKTTFIYTLSLRIVESLQIPVLVFDYKGDYRVILGELDERIKVVKLYHEPPFVFSLGRGNIEVKSKRISEALSTILRLNTGEAKILEDIISRTLLSKREVSIDDLIEYSAKYSKETSIKLRSLRKSRYYKLELPPGKVIIYDFSGLSIEEKIAFTTLLLEEVLCRYGFEPSTTLKAIICVDESWILLRDTSAGKLLLRLVKQGRGLGISIVLATQDIEDLTPEIVNNAGTVVAFPSRSQDYVDNLGRIFPLRESTKTRIRWLRPGEALIVTPGNPVPQAVRIMSVKSKS